MRKYLILLVILLTLPRLVFATGSLPGDGGEGDDDDGFDYGHEATASQSGNVADCEVRFYAIEGMQRGSFDHPSAGTTGRTPMIINFKSTFTQVPATPAEFCDYYLINRTDGGTIIGGGVAGSDIVLHVSHVGTNANQNQTIPIGNFSFTGSFAVHIVATAQQGGILAAEVVKSNATIGIAPHITSVSGPELAKLNFFQKQRITYTLAETGGDGILRIRNITWNATQPDRFISTTSGGSNKSGTLSEVTVQMINLSSSTTGELNDKRLNHTHWGGGGRDGKYHRRFTPGSLNSSVFNLTRQLLCEGFGSDLAVYNRGEVPITSGTIKDANGNQWNAGAIDRFNYSLVNDTGNTKHNTSTNFIITDGSWAVNTLIPTYANGTADHTGLQYRLNFTNFANTTSAEHNACFYSAYRVSRSYFCDSHPEKDDTLSKDTINLDDRTVEDANEVTEYEQDETVRGWAHCVNVRGESLASHTVRIRYIDANGVESSSTTRTTESDGWTPSGTPVTQTVATPFGSWLLSVNTTGNGNEGGDNETLIFARIQVKNVTYVLRFDAGPRNTANLTNRWSCVQDLGNSSFVAWVFTGADPLRTGQFNTTPLNHSINITQGKDGGNLRTTYLTFSRGSCGNVSSTEEDIRNDDFERRNFPAFSYPDVDRYVIKIIADYTNVHFNNNLTWGPGSYRLIIANNRTSPGTVNITSDIL